ncbi:TlpA family protein disulfide reductase [Lachnospiraceae bacterium KGMB03038]|nr:TlpA family protein disulfide reductase [Lachnospiraceae bacterium KGMB03038]
MKKNRIWAILALSMAILLGACASGDNEEETGAVGTGQESSEEDSEEEYGKIFGDFETVAVSGETLTQDVFGQAELSMVNIWATYCGPCIQEMPELASLHQEYADQGVQILGLISDVSDPGDEAAAKIIEETGADYVHMIPSAELQSGILSMVSAVPTTIFVDQEGNMVGKAYAGARNKEEWAQIIEEKLSEVRQ